MPTLRSQAHWLVAQNADARPKPAKELANPYARADREIKHENTTSCKNKAGRGICMISKPKNINQLRSDKLVGITPAQFLHEDRYSAILLKRTFIPPCSALPV